MWLSLKLPNLMPRFHPWRVAWWSFTLAMALILLTQLFSIGLIFERWSEPLRFIRLFIMPLIFSVCLLLMPVLVRRTYGWDMSLSDVFAIPKPAGVVIDEHDRVIGWDSQAESMFGYTAEEVGGGQLLADLIVPERFRAEHAARIQRYLARMPFINDQYSKIVRHRDAHEFYIEVTVTPVLVNSITTFTLALRPLRY